eukprot:TRINITY_DN67315_c8_g3_i1.p1 TRINITY_DN67315_c8_g3~~TRINITY_DN67315_c8_g3_i1.p1  ORF type:complete len:383 (+),score=16.77 TRINITY_DN67315_c8_g3_i1:46-1194(+)
MFLRRIRLLREFNSAEEAAKVIGISIPFTATQLNTVRLQRIQQFHPDKAQGEEEKEFATQQLKDISDAHKYLKEWLKAGSGIDKAFADRWQRTRKQPEPPKEHEAYDKATGEHFKVYDTRTTTAYSTDAAFTHQYQTPGRPATPRTPDNSSNMLIYSLGLTVICATLGYLYLRLLKRIAGGVVPEKRVHPEHGVGRTDSPFAWYRRSVPTKAVARRERAKYGLRHHTNSWLNRSDEEKAELEEWYQNYIKQSREIEKFMRAWRLCEHNGKLNILDRKIFRPSPEHDAALADKQQRMIDAHVKHGFGFPPYLSPPTKEEVARSQPTNFGKNMRVAREKKIGLKSPNERWAEPKPAVPYVLPEGSITVAEWTERKNTIVADGAA